MKHKLREAALGIGLAASGAENVEAQPAILKTELSSAHEVKEQDRQTPEYRKQQEDLKQQMEEMAGSLHQFSQFTLKLTINSETPTQLGESTQLLRATAKFAGLKMHRKIDAGELLVAINSAADALDPEEYAFEGLNDPATLQDLSERLNAIAESLAEIDVPEAWSDNEADIIDQARTETMENIALLLGKLETQQLKLEKRTPRKP